MVLSQLQQLQGKGFFRTYIQGRTFLSIRIQVLEENI